MQKTFGHIGLNQPEPQQRNALEVAVKMILDNLKFADRELDVTAEVCPMTFVRTRLALDAMLSGQTLLVRLRGEEPLRSVPATAAAQGHAVISVETEPDGSGAVLIRRR